MQECQAANTSTEFIDWLAFLELEWETRTKEEYCLAAIAAEIRAIREMFSKSPKQVNINDLLLPWGRDDTVTILKKKKGPEKKHEIGPELIKDPKWAYINQKAKMAWGVRLGKGIS